MTSISNYYCFKTASECIGCAHGLVRSTGAALAPAAGIFAPGEINLTFHVQGRAPRWPDIFGTDQYPNVKIFTRALADQMLAAGFTGIDFQPVKFRFGNIKGGLRGKEHLCPEYLWGRIFGTLSVRHYFNGQPATLDATGTRVLNSVADILKASHRVEVGDDESASDYCQLLPTAGTVAIAISSRVAQLFNSLKIKGISIFAKGNGCLAQWG